MSAPSKLPALDVARAIMADPRKKFTVSVLDIIGICQALIDAEDTPAPAISIELAEAARALIVAEANHTMAKGDDGYAPLKVGLKREQAFLTFKSLFEQEFPND
jgi:hypothetical protein